MIDRRDISGLTIAVLAHAGLIAAIYFWPWHEREAPVPPPEPIQVTLAEDVGLVSAAPDPSTEPPAQAQAGQEDATDTQAAPPEPEPEKKPDPVPPKQNPDAAKQPPKPPKANQQAQQGNGRGRPGLDFKNDDFAPNPGPAPQKTEGTGQKSQATMTGEAQRNIDSAIRDALLPCARRQMIPAPEARQIYAIVQMSLNRDGSLASFRIVGHEGVNDSNERYVTRVDDAVEAVFASCTPIRGLPPELYDVPRGWKSRKFRYRLNN